MSTKRAFIIFIALLLSGVSFAQTSTATPIPTPALIDNYDDMQNFMATAAAQSNQVPDNIISPSGQALITQQDPTLLFSYAKWLFSTNTAYELLGRTFAPIAINLFILLIIVVTLTTVWFLVMFIVLLVQTMVWLMNQVLKFIPFLG